MSVHFILAYMLTAFLVQTRYYIHLGSWYSISQEYKSNHV